MKKLILAAVCAFGMLANAGTTINVVENGKTNEVDAIEWANNCPTNTEFQPKLVQQVKKLDENVLKNFDSIAAKKNCRAYTIALPKCRLNQYYHEEKKYQPNAENFVTEFLKKFEESKSVSFTDWEIYNIALKISRGNTCISQDWIKSFLGNKVPKAAKKALYKQGKSFVEKDGVNPIKVYVDKVNAAFNAPKYQGLQELMTELELYTEFNWTIVEPKTDKEIEDLKVAILSGDKDFDSANQNVLKVYLGLEEYNKFVKRYNEGE